MTTSRSLLISIALLLLSACSSNRPATPIPAVIAAQATQAYSGAASQVAIAQATYESEAASINATAVWQATDTSINATLSAHDVAYLPTRAAVQATLDAARAGEAQARLDIAQVQYQIAKQRGADEVSISNAQVMSATDAMRAASLMRQTDIDRANDFMYLLPDLVGRWIPVVFFIVGAFCLWWIVRAVAARIAGDTDRAMLVLGYAMHPALLPPPHEDVYEIEETREHGNTGNTGNTPQNTGNTLNTVFPVYHQGDVTYLPRMTTDERLAVMKAKTDAIRILQAAAEYNQVNTGGDPARIARYDAIGVKSEDRGAVCEMLEALNPAAVSIQRGGKSNEQGTFVTPEYGANVVSLLRLITSNDVRLYPIGFRSEAVDAAEVLNSAVKAVPGVTR